MSSTIQATIDRWIAGEAGNNSRLAEEVIAEGFRMVGPAGFVLDRDQWLARYEHGLHNDAFALTDLEIREYGDTAIGIGVQRQETTYSGGTNNGNFRITLILANQAGDWKLLGYHLSPMMQSPA